MNKERTLPVPGEFYRHFKNRFYQIVTIAYHSETSEPMVVYQALYGEFKVWVRPLSMFMEEVDHVKYPEADLTYRFEMVERPGAGAGQASDFGQAGQSSQAASRAAQASQSTGRTGSGYGEDRPMNPYLLEFFDAMDEKRYDKMLEALAKMSGLATQKEIDDICMVLDMQTVGVSIMEQIADIRRHIQMLRKFDGERLR